MECEIPSKVEFAIQIKGPACVEDVKIKLKENGVKLEDIETICDSQKSEKECRIVIRTAKPWIHLQEMIEGTGKRAVLVGFSDQAAVAMLDKGDDKNVKGVIRFCSIAAGITGIVIDGVIDGLKPQQEHTLSICEFGDVSQGSDSLGDIYKKASYTIKSDSLGRSTIRTIDNNLNVSELIGRSVAVSSISSSRFSFGIISRAAGNNW
jgi:hypothetical protein